MGNVLWAMERHPQWPLRLLAEHTANSAHDATTATSIGGKRSIDGLLDVGLLVCYGIDHLHLWGDSVVADVGNCAPLSSAGICHVHLDLLVPTRHTATCSDLGEVLGIAEDVHRNDDIFVLSHVHIDDLTVTVRVVNLSADTFITVVEDARSSLVAIVDVSGTTIPINGEDMSVKVDRGLPTGNNLKLCPIERSTLVLGLQGDLLLQFHVTVLMG